MTETDPNRIHISKDSEVASSKDGTLTKDEIFHLLQNARRRQVLRYLADSDGPVDMSDLAEQVTAWEYNITVQQITSDQRRRVYISLYQNHLPKLADSGLITYNQSRGIVERTSLADQATPYLDRNETESNWIQYYTGVTTFSTLVIGVLWIGFGSVPSLSNVGLILSIILLHASVTFAMAANNERVSLFQVLTTPFKRCGMRMMSSLNSLQRVRLVIQIVK